MPDAYGQPVFWTNIYLFKILWCNVTWQATNPVGSVDKMWLTTNIRGNHMNTELTELVFILDRSGLMGAWNSDWKNRKCTETSFGGSQGGKNHICYYYRWIR